MAGSFSIATITRELQGLSLTGVERIDKKPLGKGSYGQVFAVKHGGRMYAAKQIHSILIEVVGIEEKQAVRESFLKECHCCKDLDHPNIVRFIGVYYPDPDAILPVMVMELMDASLTDFVKTPNISMKLKVSILHDISQGLGFLHCRDSPIIHRNLSPNNILLSQNSVAKIGDLGVAKVVKVGSKGTQSKLTRAPGTADFMPPEALADDPTYSTGLDIFSYGGLILHVINQEWPTPTIVVEYDSKMNPLNILTEVERRQKYHNMMVGEDTVMKTLRALVVSCLDNDPAKRPTTANVVEMLKELKKFEVIKGDEHKRCAKGGTIMTSVSPEHTVKRQPQQQSPVIDEKPYKKYDRVKAFDVNGQSVKGTVKWIGKNKKALSDRAYIVGIHTDQVIQNLQGRFPYHMTGMSHYIEESKHHSTLFLPGYFVKKIGDQDDNGGDNHKHAHSTKSVKHNHYYNPQDVMSVTIDSKDRRRQTISTAMVKETQKGTSKKVEQSNKEIQREQEQAKSNERRLRLQRIKNELQIGEIKGFDDIMLDPERQEKIFEDLKRQKDMLGPKRQAEDLKQQKNKENHQSSSSRAKTTNTEPSPVEPDPQRKPQQSTYPLPRDIHSQGMSQQSMHQHGMPRQVMNSQEIYQQQKMQHIVHPQGLHPQGLNNPQLDSYQKRYQKYQPQQYNQPSINSSNPFLKRKQSIEAYHSLQVVPNAPNNANCRNAPQTIHTWQNPSQDMYRPSPSHKQSEGSDKVPALKVGNAIQGGSDPVYYGTIKWIGNLPGSVRLIAGVEMEKPLPGATDGWHNGCQYFSCKHGKGIFIGLAALRRDERSQVV